MFETIVVPLDGSALAEGAIATAVEVCCRMRSKLELVRVVTPSDVPDVPPDLADDAAGAALSTAEDEVRSARGGPRFVLLLQPGHQ